MVLVLGGGDDPAAGVLDLAARTAGGGGGAHAGHCGQVQHRREPGRGKPLLQLSLGVFQHSEKSKARCWAACSQVVFYGNRAQQIV